MQAVTNVLKITDVCIKIQNVGVSAFTVEVQNPKLGSSQVFLNNRVNKQVIVQSYIRIIIIKYIRV